MKVCYLGLQAALIFDTINTRQLRRKWGNAVSLNLFLVHATGVEVADLLLAASFRSLGIVRRSFKDLDVETNVDNGKLLAMEGVDLEIRPSALKAIARKALARKTGARGLRSILEQSLIDTMFDLPTTSNVDKVVVDESTIEENKPPLLVYREAAKKA